MGCGEIVQFTTRPSFDRLINPASSRTPRCFMKPGNDMLCGLASSITGRLPSLNDARTFRRVESESAANTASRSASSYLTIRFSISRNDRLVKYRSAFAEYSLNAFNAKVSET